jgi:hypothetical protein
MVTRHDHIKEIVPQIVPRIVPETSSKNAIFFGGFRYYFGTTVEHAAKGPQMSKNWKQSTVNGRPAWATALCSVPTSSISYLFFWRTLSLTPYDVTDPTFDFYGVRTFFPHNTRRSHKIGRHRLFSNNKAPLRMRLLAHNACARCIFVYEGAVKALPAHHLRRHHGGSVVFVSYFGQQKLFHLKPGSITYRWKAVFLKETNMPVK